MSKEARNKALEALQYQSMVENYQGGHGDDIEVGDSPQDSRDEEGTDDGMPVDEEGRLSPQRKRSSTEGDDSGKKEKKRRTDDPFTEPQEVFEDGNVKILVEKVMHRKNTRYSLEDNLYEMKVHTLKKDATPPMLISLEDSIKKALKHMIDVLKKGYDTTEHRQIYFTVVESNILRHTHFLCNIGNPKTAILLIKQIGKCYIFIYCLDIPCFPRAN